MGAGLLSLEAAMWLKQAGWGPAHVVDVDAQRARRALAYGADALRLPARAGLALDFKGAPEAMEAALNAVRPGGVLPRAGALCPSRFLALAAEDVMRRMLRMEGIHN
jgi:alcohol dehydrogenase